MLNVFVNLFPKFVLVFALIALACVCAIGFAFGLRRLGCFDRFCWLFHRFHHPTSWFGWFCTVPLLCVLLVMGSEKNGGGGDTNAPPPTMSAPMMMGGMGSVPSEISSADIARGYREVEVTAQPLVEMPEGSVTNELLRRRGGFDWAFRVTPEGWSFPYDGGFLTGVTVLARGEVRPDVGTLYFPVPFTNGVSLLPEAKWNLLGGAPSVFAHGVTASNSLLLAWWNALVDRDLSTPTNIQFELFPDGRFAWRTDNASQVYLPVLPFDWDGDGLENSVDPSPLVAGPDAHGTNSEWYNTVCSNVFVSVVNPNNPNNQTIPEGVSFRTNVNAQAYYFVDVVAERGPTPIYFTADGPSDLGNPIVVVRAGETNHVPLLLGATYSVTSVVSFAVYAPTNEIVTVVTNSPRDYTVTWPLTVVVSDSDDDRVPFPVVEDGRLGGSYLAAGACCEHARMGISCYDGCTCACPGCSSRLCYNYCGYSLELGTFWCACGDDPPPPPPDPVIGSFSVSFSKSAVIFEDRYEDSVGTWVERQSTKTRLTVSASGGVYGGSFSMIQQNLDKLSRVGGAAISLPTSKILAPFETYYVTFLCEGVSASGTEGDVEVCGTFLSNLGMAGMMTSRAEATVVRIEIQATIDPPDESARCSNRHTYGVCEIIECLHRPSDAVITWNPVGGGDFTSGKYYHCPLTGCNSPLSVSCAGTTYTPEIFVLEPDSVKAVLRHGISRASVVEFAPSGQAGGIGMLLKLFVRPFHVSFSQIAIQEVPSLTYQTSGYFLNPYFNGAFAHTTGVGGAGAGNWVDVDHENMFGYDTAAYQDTIPWLTPTGQVTTNSAYAWTEGYVYIDNPFGWNVKGTNGRVSSHKIFAADTKDEILLHATGSVGVRKLINQVTRSTNDVITLNGKVLQ